MSCVAGAWHWDTAAGPLGPEGCWLRPGMADEQRSQNLSILLLEFPINSIFVPFGLKFHK